MNFRPPASESERTDWDPVYLHSRREAVVIFIVWIVALLWSIPYCYLNGYVDAEQLTTVVGIPSWALWGIAVPWVIANLFTVWFCLRYMVDDPLDEAHRGGERQS